MIAKVNIKRFRGDTYDIVLKLTENNQPFQADIYNWRLVVTSEQFPIDNTSKIFETTGTGSQDGIVIFPITEQQANLVGTYFFEVEGTHKTTNKKRTFVDGKIEFIQDKAK